MQKKTENKMIKRRLISAYISSVVSISLMLLLVGIAALLMVNTRNVSDYFKESLKISVILKQEATDEDAVELCAELAEKAYVHGAEVVTREQGTEELKEMLGEDFLSVFETSPVPVSVDLTLVADYVSPDSIAVVTPLILQHPLVEEVECQQSLVDALNANLTKISMILAVFISLLFFISFVLINNMVRLDVFSRRFTVHAMKLVGATRAFIRGPYLLRALVQGLVASLIAIGAIQLILSLVGRSFPALFDIFSRGGLLLVWAVVVAGGIIICTGSTWLIVNRLVGMKKDDLYT